MYAAKAARLQKTAVGASAFMRFFSATFCGCWSLLAQSPYTQPQNVIYSRDVTRHLAQLFFNNYLNQLYKTIIVSFFVTNVM